MLQNSQLPCGLSFEVQQQYREAHTASWFHQTPNNAFQRAQQSVTPFANAKVVPLCSAAELSR